MIFLSESDFFLNFVDAINQIMFLKKRNNENLDSDFLFCHQLDHNISIHQIWDQNNKTKCAEKHTQPPF